MTRQITLPTPRPPEVRALSDGRVLILTAGAGMLQVADAGLATLAPVVDATNSPASRFPSNGGRLIAASGDTTYVLDFAAQAVRVLDRSLRVVRRIPVDQKYIRSLSNPGSPLAFDKSGRLIYLDPFASQRAVVGVQSLADSQTIARISLTADGRDSLGVVRRAGSTTTQKERPGQPPLVTITVPLVDVGDAWAVTSDGAVALIRSSDFHVDWIEGDRTRRSAPVTWPWHRYTDAEKDSLKANATVGPVAPAGGRAPTVSIRVSGTSVSTPVPPSGPPFEVASATSFEMPDAEPAFRPFSARGDLEGRVWLALGARTRGAPEPPVYGILDKSGRLVDRVQFPRFRSLVGFGPGGAVYMTWTNSPQSVVVERYEYRKP